MLIKVGDIRYYKIKEFNYKYRYITKTMQIPVSDADFYQRKINRLQKDIAHLNQQLNMTRIRLRSAEDFQIKYQLLARQSQQDNIRLKKIQQTQRNKFAQLLVGEIDKVNKQWAIKTVSIQQEIKQQYRQQNEKLIAKIQELEKKNKQMNQKSEQMDVILFKNKKIAKDLQSLQEIIEQNRINNQRQREEELRACRENLTKKITQKFNIQKLNYEQNIAKLSQKNEKLELELMKAELSLRQRNKYTISQTSRRQQHNPSCITDQLKKLQNLLKQKDTQIEELQVSKIQQQQYQIKQLKQLKNYNKELQQKIFYFQTDHQVQIINLKNRMQETLTQELKQKQHQCVLIEKQHMKDMQLFNQKILKEKTELQHIRKIQQAQIAKLKQDKQKLQKKLIDLKSRLKEYEYNQEVNQTQNIIKSYKNIDKKDDGSTQYQDGVTFLERQLRKATIKLQKKNTQVGQLLSKINNNTEQFQKQIEEQKQKYTQDIKNLNEKIQNLQQDIRQLNQQIRKKQKQIKDQQIQFIKQLNQINAQNRSLHNINNDLQRDYTRMLESKKVIQKSFREERQRSITSKSQIAITKKQKWIQLEKLKTQIEIIYKQKQQQIKTAFQVQLNDMRVQNDKLRRDKQLIEQQLKDLKQKITNNKGEKAQIEKQNIYSDYHKKLASVNLQIALTQNLYNTLIKAKSRVNKIQEPIKSEPTQKQTSIKNQLQNQKLKPKKSDFDRYLQKAQDRSYKSFQRSVKQIDKLSSNESKQIQINIVEQFQRNQHQYLQPMAFELDQDSKSPTFTLLHSFNAKS